MIAAGLLAKKARRARPAVQAVGEDVARPGLEGRHRVLRAGRPDRADLEALGFHLVGYGCTTCIGNSGPLPEEISEVVNDEDLAVVSRALGQPQLRGPHQPRRPGELPRVAAAGRRLRARRHDGHRPARRADRRRTRTARTSSSRTSGRPTEEVARRRRGRPCTRSMFRQSYGEVFEGDEHWRGLEVPEGDRFAWDDDSTYVRRPPFFEDIPKEPTAPERHRGRARARGARRLASRPTTSRPPARSRRTRPRASTCWSTASSPRTSTPTARAAATTR